MCTAVPQAMSQTWTNLSFIDPTQKSAEDLKLILSFLEKSLPLRMVPLGKTKGRTLLAKEWIFGGKFLVRWLKDYATVRYLGLINYISDL